MVPVCIVAIMGMRVIQSFYNKKASIVLAPGARPYMVYLIMMQGFAAGFAAVTLICSGNFSGFNAQAVWIATGSGISLTAGSLCGILALSGGTIVLNSVFSTAGLIVPCLLGMFFFGEAMSGIQWICVGVLLASAVLLIDSSQKVVGGFSLKTFLLLLTTLLSNGMVMFCQKLFGVLQPQGNVSLFSLLTFLIPTGILSVVWLIFPKTGSTSAACFKKLVLYAALLAIAVFVIQQLVTILTSLVSSAVLFSLVNGGATVIAAIVGAVAYKEKITVKSVVGMLLAIAAMIGIKMGG